MQFKIGAVTHKMLFRFCYCWPFNVGAIKSLHVWFSAVVGVCSWHDRSALSVQCLRKYCAAFTNPQETRWNELRPETHILHMQRSHTHTHSYTVAHGWWDRMSGKQRFQRRPLTKKIKTLDNQSYYKFFLQPLRSYWLSSCVKQSRSKTGQWSLCSWTLMGTCCSCHPLGQLVLAQ